MSRFRRRLMGLAALRQAKADDFVRVEYLENVSNAYIDIGFPLKGAYKTEIGFIITNADAGNGVDGYCIFGARQSATDSTYSILYDRRDGYKLYCDYNSYEYSRTELIITPNNKIDIVLDKDKTIINNTTVSHNQVNFTTPYNGRIFDFVNRPNPTTWKNTQMKLFYCRIYNENTELIRDYIPMYQISTDTYGLWDRVEEKFYTSPNGVKFTGGERVIADANDNIYYLKNYVVARGYYSYANTGIKGNSNDLLKVDIMVTSRPSTSYCWLIGYSSSEKDRFGIYWRNSGSGYKWCVDFWRGSGYSNRRASTIYPNLNQRYDLIVGNPSTTQNNLSYMEDKRTNTVIFPEAEISPIGSNTTYYVSEFRDTKGNYYVRWYNLEIYKTMSGKKELVLHWIPVQRCSDGVWGFFDKVKEDFHSSEGREEFTGA